MTQETVSGAFPRWSGAFWRARPAGEPVPHTGHIWCSDGEKVWLVDSTGLPQQFSHAVLVKFWMPCDVPSPPTASEIAAASATLLV